MTRSDHQIFYTALAYIAVYLRTPDAGEQVEPAHILARHIEAYCQQHIETAFRPVEIRFANDTGAVKLDAVINRHIKELREAESTVLPQDRETLLKFYDRLQLRKSRRMQSVFYETVNTEMLANAVLKYLDEEIDGSEAGS